MQPKARWQYILGLAIIPIAIIALSGSGSLRLRQLKTFAAKDLSTRATLRLTGFKQSSEDYTPEDNVGAVLGRYRSESPEMEVGYALALMQRADENIIGLQKLTQAGKKQGYTKELCAHILRHAMRLDLLKEKTEVCEMKGEARPRQLKFPTNQLPGEVYEAVIQGEKLDPDNAFFPLMRAVIIFAAPFQNDPVVDKQALEAVQSATQKSRYEDYVANEAKLVNRVYARAYGEQIVLQTAVIHNEVVAPQFGAIRNLARILTHKAVTSVKNGDVAKGVAYRRHLFRIGRLLQNASIYLANLTGDSVIKLALQPSITPPKERKAAAAYRAEMADFLKKHGESSLSQWVLDNRQIAQNRHDDLILKEATSRIIGAKDESYLSEFYGWLADMGMWMTICNLLLLALVALYFRFNPSENRGTALGSALLLVGATAFWRPCLSFLANLREITRSLPIGIEKPRMEGFWEWSPTQFMAAMWALSWAFPLILVLICGIFSLAKKRPFAQSLATACFLGAALLLWAIAFSPTPQREASIRREMARFTAHEGRFLAEKAGKVWLTAPPAP